MPSPPDRDRRWSVPAVIAAFVAVAVVLFARPLLGLGSLLPVDIVEQAAPWRASAPPGQVPDNPFLSDTIDVHAHFASLADDLRSGTASWWDRSVGGGIPTLKAGFSPLLWPYLLVPAWYAPGLVAAVRTLVAAGLTYGFARELRADRSAAVVAGVAYAASGFLVGWSGWPQSNVAALLPGLFWAVERIVRRPSVRGAVPLAGVVAAMVVSNFPVITAYGLLAAGGYAVARLATDGLRPTEWVRPAAVALWGGVLAALLASLHLLAFGEYFDWADNSARERLPADTSIGSDYLLSIPFPRPFGAHHTGPAFWGAGQNWVETQAYAGVAVMVLAVVALAAGGRRRGATGDAAIRAVAVRALWGVAVFGAWVSYVGGPVTELVQSLPLLGQNSVGRARVLANLALAVLAGLGVQAWIDARRGVAGVDLRRGLRTGAVGAVAVVVLTLPVWWRWIDGARDRGLVVETARALVVPGLAGVAVVAALWWFRPSQGRAGVAGVAAAVVAVELVLAGASIATVVDRDRADLTTPAHDVAIAALDPGLRMGADARTFFANTGQLTGLDDVRGHLQTPAGWREAYRALDPEHFRPPGSVTNPWFSSVDLASPALDRLGVGVWAVDPRVPIAGTRLVPPGAGGTVVLFPDAPQAGAPVEVPAGGLRAVAVRVVGPATGEIRATVTAAGASFEATATVEAASSSDGWVDLALPGIDAAPGSPVEVELTATGGTAVPVGGVDGSVAVATVAADDGARLLRAGDVTLYARPSAAAARLVHAVVVEERVGPEVHLGDLGAGVGVVAADAPTDLPESVPPGAEGTATVVAAEGDDIVVEVETTAPALVVIAQPEYPGWTAEVDGAEVPILRVDDAFPGVPVPAGRHTVTLRYRPSDLPLALVLTGLGVLALAVTWWLGGPRSRRRDVATLAR